MSFRALLTHVVGLALVLWGVLVGIGFAIAQPRGIPKTAKGALTS